MPRAAHDNDDAETQLRAIAVRAMVKHASDTAAATEAIWNAVRKGPALMECLFRLEYQRAIGALLYRVRMDLLYKAGTNALATAIERRGVVVATELRNLDRKRREQEKADEAAENEREMAAYQKRMAAWRATAIGNLTVYGKPIWQESVAGIRTWLENQRRRWRCVELLISGVPDDGRPLEYYRRPHEVAELWQRAQTEE